MGRLSHLKLKKRKNFIDYFEEIQYKEDTGGIMGDSDKVKTQKPSLWTTTIEDMDESFLPTSEEIKKTIQHIKDNNIDINKPVPEIEEMMKMFKPQQ